MFCPHCHNKIPDGSNICPLCYANLAGVRPQQTPREDTRGEGEAPVRQEHAAPARKSSKKTAYTKGSRGGRRNADRTPMIIAVGLILILVIIIAMIIRSMFSAGTPQSVATPLPQTQTTSEPNFIVFGATPTPVTAATPTPNLEITPTPAPTQPPVTSYRTLKRGEHGAEVVTLQQALVELGFLNGATDGNFGTATETAVRNFQKANGLDSDGIAGKMTLEKLYELSSVTPMPETTVGPGDIMDLPG